MELCEDEMHFLMICPLYMEEIIFLIYISSTDNSDFSNLSDFKKMIYLMQYCQNELMSLEHSLEAWNIRTSKLKR